MEKVINLVQELLNNDKSGHGIDHALRVKDLAIKLADNTNANKEIIILASLLHDVDDYKLVGLDKIEELTNAKNILDACNINKDIKIKVLDIIKNMGFKNRLQGIYPKTLEGKIVSDADMCDAIGSIGIIRSIEYSLDKEHPIFDKDNYPNLELDYNKYINNKETAINHMFEKYLKIPSLLLTESGQIEGKKRIKIVVDFLREYFRELNLDDWNEILNKFLIKNKL